MKRLQILSLYFLILLSGNGLTQNLPDYIQTDKIVRLINDYKACNELNDSLLLRLEKANFVIDELIEVKEIAKEAVTENEQNKKKLIRNRRIAIGSVLLNATFVFLTYFY